MSNPLPTAIQRVLDAPMNDAKIKHMVDRFLGWRLPEEFHPDAGISFKAVYNEHTQHGPSWHEPTGTNLFDATQAESMVRYMIAGAPDANVNDHYESHEALRDIVGLLAEREALNGGGPNFAARWARALRIAQEIFEP